MSADVWRVMLDEVKRANTEFVHRVNRHSVQWKKADIMLGRIQGVCRIIEQSVDRIPHAWKVRMIEELKSIQMYTPWKRYVGWHRGRRAISRAIRALEKNI